MLTLRFLIFCTFKFFIIQHKTIAVSDPPNPLKDYVLTCDVQVKREDMRFISPICTALANSNGSDVSLLEIKPLRPQRMMFMLTINYVPYGEWRNFMTQDHKIDEIFQKIKKNKVNSIAFDFMYQDGDIPFDPDFNSLICPFILKIKKQFNGILVGLWVRHYWVQSAFDLQIIDKEVDYYILKSYGYRRCTYEDLYLGWDHRTTTDKDMADSFGGLEVGKFNFRKVLLVIDIISYSFHFDKGGPAINTHSEVCRDRKSKYRRFCVDNLGQLFYKAKQAFSKQIMGLYVLYADYDDYLGTCKCKDENGDASFPGLKVLKQGIDGEDAIKHIETCWAYGLYKRNVPTFS